MNKVCVCVLAYNEQRHIQGTIHSILAGNGNTPFDIIVYANGCTDGTADVVRKLCETTPNLQLRELEKASKPNAWNTAFTENTNPILFFSDGDVRPEAGSVAALQRYFNENSNISLVCSQFWPSSRGMTIERRLTGFLQIPLKQDFHAGGFYAVRRSHLMARFKEKGLAGIPEGIVGEDTFLELLLPRDAFLVAKERVYFKPPSFRDYWRYCARIRWQEEQLLHAYGELLGDRRETLRRSWLNRLFGKFNTGQGASRTLLGFTSAGSRMIVQTMFRWRINQSYRELGPVFLDGKTILSQATRSVSSK